MLKLSVILIGFCSLLIYRLIYRKRLSICGKTILITGASSGLGESLARYLFNERCQLILLARRIDRLEKICNDLINLHPTYPKPKIIPIDLLSYDQLTSSTLLMNVINNENIDCLINNAGISQRTSILDTPINIVEDIFRTNYLSMVHLTKLVLEKIIQRKQTNATIVNVSSLQGLMAVPDRSSYSASKHAVQAFSDSLRMELDESYAERNINVCVINPSYIKTELGRNALNRLNNDMEFVEENKTSAYEPDYVAKRIIKAIEYRETDVIIAPFHQHLAIWLRRIWPFLFFKIMVSRNKRLKSKKRN